MTTTDPIQPASLADLTPDVMLLLAVIDGLVDWRGRNGGCGCDPTKRVTPEQAARYEALDSLAAALGAATVGDFA